MAVSHECVYLHVYANKAAGGDLDKNLRSQKPRRKRYLCGRDRRGQIPNRRPISVRPSHIEDRKQVGNWEEGDTVIGVAHKQAIDQAPGIQTYFAEPYCKWQRGSYENLNGLLRQ